MNLSRALLAHSIERKNDSLSLFPQVYFLFSYLSFLIKRVERIKILLITLICNLHIFLHFGWENEKKTMNRTRWLRCSMKENKLNYHNIQMNIIRNNFQNSCSNIAIVEVSEKSSPANIVIRKYCSRAPRSNKGRPLKPSVNILHSVSALLAHITIACRSIIWSFVHTWKCYASIALKVKLTNENNSWKKPLLLFSLLFHCLFFAAIAILENVLWKWSRKQNREIEYSDLFKWTMYIHECTATSVHCDSHFVQLLYGYFVALARKCHTNELACTGIALHVVHTYTYTGEKRASEQYRMDCFALPRLAYEIESGNVHLSWSLYWCSTFSTWFVAFI